MKKILYPTLLCFVVVLIAGACHKNNNNGQEAVTFQNIVGTYKISKVEVSNGQISENLTDSIDQCQKDDLFHFNKDSTLFYEDAGVACTPNGSFTTNWSVTGNTLIIQTNGTSTATIKSLTSTTLVLSSADSTYYPEIITTTDTFTRQ